MEPETTPPTTEPIAEPTPEPKPLPEGWEEAVSPVDGRVYYYNAASGATSWTYPSNSEPVEDEVQTAPSYVPTIVPSIGDFSGILANRSTMTVSASKSMDPPAANDVETGIYTKMTDYDPAQPINTHRCYSVLALILFFPLGVFALFSSFSTVTKWHAGQYEKAHDCSQRTVLLSRISCIIGVLFWGYFTYCYLAEPGPYNFIPREWYPEVHFKWLEGEA